MIDKSALLKASIPEREVVVAGKGTVRVRGLSRAEVIHMGQLGQENLDAAEVYMLVAALVDPALDAAEVEEWRRLAPAGEIDPITDAVNELSGLTEMALKAAAKSFRDEPGAQAGVPRGS